MSQTRKMTYREAVRTALQDALRSDSHVFLLGEDVGCYGGAHACSKGLLEEFGEERIRDTPLSESTFVGRPIQRAAGGANGGRRGAAGPADISKAVARREGGNVSLITFGGSLHKTLEAAVQAYFWPPWIAGFRCRRSYDYR